ncbi:hypothetical protein OE749_07090 [Aestuariibacter sp. AA17]|uniref:HlyD family secretion protein n=1 Tax=Fluctibacter corallii TaxID=2984329 RepID=A0ABT3A6Z2_9ALTE|nr:hypothetical protein [Aestuariibacter sp. AA17]MCV2884455.1 hypothetical protein [Aestuariibacter sp. AA17]
MSFNCVIRSLVGALLCIFALSSLAQEQIESISFYGVVSYQKQKPIYSQFDGILEEVYVKGGDRLKTNQPLVRITREEVGYSEILIRNTIENAVVSRLDLQEGHKVDRFSQIMMVADLSQYVVKIDVSQRDLLRLGEIGDASVIFSPNSTQPKEMQGEVYAINEPQQGDFGLFRIEVVVDCTKKCGHQVRSGSIAKVMLNSAISHQSTASLGSH